MFEFINSSFAFIQVSQQYPFILVTVFIMYMHYRKTIFNQVAHFIHINLSAALLIGLIVFVSGIEAAYDSRVRSDVINLMHKCTMDSGKRT